MIIPITTHKNHSILKQDIVFHAVYGLLIAVLLFTVGCSSLETINSGKFTYSQDSPSSPLEWPPPPQQPRIRFLRSISHPSDIGIKKGWFKRAMDNLFGTEKFEGVMLRPYGIYVASERLFVTDPGSHMVHIFDLGGKNYFTIKEAQGEELPSPVGIAVDSHGEIFVSDSFLKRILVFDKDGKYIRDIGSQNMFLRPTGIALDGDRIYIIDTQAHRVLVFNNRNNSYLFDFGKNGIGSSEFNYPTHIFSSSDHRLYITDSMNFRVQIFDRDGNYLSSFGRHGDGTGDFSKPKGIAVDSDNNIYVADADFDAVQIFDGKGTLLLGFGNTGSKAGEFVLPAGSFIDDQARLYIADSYNRRIQVFQYLKATKN